MPFPTLVQPARTHNVVVTEDATDVTEGGVIGDTLASDGNRRRTKMNFNTN